MVYSLSTPWILSRISMILFDGTIGVTELRASLLTGCLVVQRRIRTVHRNGIEQACSNLSASYTVDHLKDKSFVTPYCFLYHTNVHLVLPSRATISPVSASSHVHQLDNIMN